MTFQSQLDSLQASIDNIQSQLTTIQAYLEASGPNAVVVLTSGSSWTVPQGVTTLLKVEAIGGGQGGSTAGAGNGGGYSWLTNYSVTPGTTIPYSIGLGGAGSTSSTQNNGGDTWFNSTTTLLALGGNSSSSPAPGGGYHQTSGQGAAGPVWSLNSSKDADMGFGGRGGANASPTVNCLPGGTGSEWGDGIGCGGGGGNAGSSGNTCAGGNGGLYGGGGGNSDTKGGDGAQGVLVITFARV